METYVVYEIFGYIASVLVAVSLMMSKIVKLRIVNLVGSAVFSLYGILIGSIPVAAMNGFIVLINVYYLLKIFRDIEYFKILKVSADNDYLEEFLNFYSGQIKKFQPDFFDEARNSDLNLFVLRDMVPAGLLMGKIEPGGKLAVQLDFVVPKYRDFKIGTFLFEDNGKYFRDRGIREVITKPGSDMHNKYLREMGFKLNEGTNTLYVKAV